ncbi:MAG: hypothetical protein HYX69_04410 [Planctomycetia bacterium]|nr:hypothetical protein [Planctomycetia bacterium]
MIVCSHIDHKKFGRDRKGNQRYRCLLCGKTWTDAVPSPLGVMRIDRKLAEQIIKCLCEGVSVRATARLTNTCKQTVIDLMLLVGGRCKRLLDSELRGLAVEEIQVDEAWQFIFCKAKTAARKGYGPETGDSYLFTAIERNTKLMVAWHFGKRDQWHTEAFCAKLARATSGHFMVSSDGWNPYRSAIVRHLGNRIEHGVVVKTFGPSPETDQRQYSPAPIVSIKKEQAFNLPKMDRICTSHVERQNLNLRTFVRRMTRLSNGFSKKWENHEAMIALYIAHYNYCRPHGTLGTTPAVASGLASHRWTVRELLEKSATH